MNSRSGARRSSARHLNNKNPQVVLEALALSPDPIIPDDLSAGGFRIVAHRKSAPDKLIPCSIHIGATAIDGCICQVAWVEKRPKKPESWAMGLLLKMSDKQRKFFTSCLEEIFAEEKARTAVNG